MENNSTKTNRIEHHSVKVKSKKARKVGARTKTPKVTEVEPTLEFAQPDKAGWRYAHGRGGRFCIGASKHHGTQFGLYIRTPEMSRFKFLAKFEAFKDAQAEAEKVERNGAVEPSTVS